MTDCFSADWSPNGKQLAYACTDANDEDERVGIYVMRPDGSRKRRLTRGSGNDSEPAWSPDGKSIAFSSYRSGGGDLYVMRADGSGLRQVTTNPGSEYNPDWSPDGKAIVFTQYDDSGRSRLLAVDGDGQNVRVLLADRQDLLRARVVAERYEARIHDVRLGNGVAVDQRHDAGWLGTYPPDHDERQFRTCVVARRTANRVSLEPPG